MRSITPLLAAAMAGQLAGRAVDINHGPIADGPTLANFNPSDVPRKLSNDPLHKDFRPDFMRVGVRIDGVERNYVAWYDIDAGVYQRIGSDETYYTGKIEPFWRSPETRQDRRLLKRWFDKKARK
jgi:hypothetical protein